MSNGPENPCNTQYRLEKNAEFEKKWPNGDVAYLSRYFLIYMSTDEWRIFINK